MIINDLSVKTIISKSITVPVPNLGDNAEIIVRKMSVGDTILIANMISKHAKDGFINTDLAMMAKLIGTMVDDNGEHIASPHELVALSSSLDSETVSALYAAYDKLNPERNTEEVFEEKKSKS